MRKKINITIVHFLFYVLLMLPTKYIFGTHSMAVDLSYKHLGGLQYEVTLNFYRDCEGISAPISPLIIANSSCSPTQYLNLSATGPGIEVSSICSSELANTLCNGGTLPGVQKYVYKGIITLPNTCKDWVFSYKICCRNNAITNLSAKKGLYVEALLDNSQTIDNSSPNFSTLPVPYICNGQPYVFSHGAIDEDGDSLVYELTEPLEKANYPVAFANGFSYQYPINTTDGTINFDYKSGKMRLIPDGNQMCVMAVKVKEYRNNQLIGYTIRDMQVIVIDCTNNLPQISETPINLIGAGSPKEGEIEICLGNTVSFQIVASDPDITDNIIFTSNIASVLPGATFAKDANTNPITATVNWTPTANDIGSKVINFTANDNACQISGIVTNSILFTVLKGVDAGKDKYYCPTGSPIQLQARGGTNFTWSLLDDSPPLGLSCSSCATPNASPSTTTTYKVTGDMPGGCTSIDTITVNVVPDFNTNTTPTDTLLLCSFSNGGNITAEVDQGNSEDYQYRWYPSTTLKNATQQTAIARPRYTTKYFVEVISPFGCSKTDSVVVKTVNLITNEIIPGDSAKTCKSLPLDVILKPIGYIYFETFDTEIHDEDFTSFSGVELKDTCGSYDAEALYFTQNTTREITTLPLDLTKGKAISFYAKAGGCNNCICDKPENDDQFENLHLEYSIDNGLNWIKIDSLNAEIYNKLAEFKYVTLALPSGAKTNNTLIRFIQYNHNGLNKDVWMIDDFGISDGLSTYSYNWTPSEYLNFNDIKDPIASPLKDTIIKLEITDLETGCKLIDSIKIKIENDFELTVTPDSSNFCSNYFPINLLASPFPPGSYEFEWTPVAGLNNSTIANPILIPTKNTTYKVIVKNTKSDCIIEDSVKAYTIPNFKVAITPDSINLCDKKDTVLLTSTINRSGAFTYSWTPSAKLTSNNTETTKAFDLITPTEIILSVYDFTPNCSARDTVEVNYFLDFDMILKKDTSICPEKEVQIEVTSSDPTLKYAWSPLSLMNDSTIHNPTTYPTKDTTIFLYTTKNELVECTRKDSIKISIDQSFKLIPQPDTIACQNNPITLNATPNNNDEYNFEWSPKELFENNNIKNGIATLSEDTTIIVWAQNKTTGCEDKDTIRIKLHPDFNFSTNKQVTICPNKNEVTLVATIDDDPNKYEAFWKPYNAFSDSSLFIQKINISEATDFPIVIHQIGGCWKSDTVKATLYEPSLNLSHIADTSINEGDSIILYASGAQNYNWITSDTIISKSNSFLFNPKNETQFIIKGNDECFIDSGLVNIYINPLYFNIPNFITPNGDNINDVFRITNFGKYWDIKIYNRWGNLIYQKEQYKDEWGAENINDGTYWYEIIDTRDNHLYKGWIQVTR